VVRQMNEDKELHREIGSLLTHVETLNREMKELKTDVRQLRDDFAKVKGGGRVLIGISAFLGSGLTWGLTQLFGKH
jgi:predicted RNase H-like nuclease (RuvC/YqgF family)